MISQTFRNIYQGSCYSILLITVFLTLGGLSQVTNAQNDYLLDSLADAAKQAVLHVDPSIHSDRLVVSNIKIENNWAGGTVVVRAMDGIHGSPRLIRFIARWSSQWQVTLETEADFEVHVTSGPMTLFEPATRALWLNRTRDAAQRGGNDDASLALPFNAGETWWFNGTHGTEPTREAIDFTYGDAQMADGLVRAARDGVVYRDLNCPNYVQIDHADGWSTGYYHLINEVVTNGQNVNIGDVIGTEGNGVGCGGFSTNPHVHWSLLRNGQPLDLHGMAAGGWIFEDGSTSYEGCMLRVSDNFRSCEGQDLTSNGLIGSGSNNNSNYWIFNRSLLGWTMNSSLSLGGYEGNSFQGAPYWQITGNDPFLTGPNFSASSAISYKGVFIEMMSTNDACGYVYFRRSGDTGFDNSRRVSFSPIADGQIRRYLVDMRENPNWNGNIVQLGLQPGCQQQNNSEIMLLRLDLVAQITEANTEILQFPNLDSLEQIRDYWILRSVYWWVTGSGKVTLGRTAAFNEFLDPPAILGQEIGAVAPGSTFRMEIKLGNDDVIDHRVQVGIRDSDSYAAAATCEFLLEAQTGKSIYTIQGITGEAMHHALFEIYLLTATNTVYTTIPELINIEVDDASVVYDPTLNITNTICNGESNEMPLRIYPSDAETLVDQHDWPRFTFQQMQGAEWYQIWVGSDDYSYTALFDWFEASQICDAGVCTVPTDIWLSNGDYAWWFNYWGAAFQTLDYWNRTTFSVDFATPSSTFTLTNPAAGATITSTPSTIEWARDTNVLWYQVWVGTDDYLHTSAFNWYDATEICDDVTCSLDVSGASFPDGGYEVWAEMWGPNGYVTWPAMPNATFTLEPSAPPAQPRPSRG